tara:strand:- start:438 stop:1820 length:1383 start_codon:yes stop_codon:yes gene_type:complete
MADTQLDRLKAQIESVDQTMAGALQRFGELGKAGNKQWTLFARITSGSWLWRFQARLRAVANIVELMTDAQAKANVEMLDSIKIRADLADALKDSNDGYNKAMTALTRLRDGDWTEDYIKNLKQIKEDEVIKAMIEEYGDLEEALEKTSTMYKNLRDNARKAEKMSKDGIFKFYKEKFVEGFMKETSIAGVRKRLGKIGGALNPFEKGEETGEVGRYGSPIHKIGFKKNNIFVKAAKFFIGGFKMIPKVLYGLFRGLMVFSLYGMMVILGLLLVIPIFKQIPKWFKMVEKEFGVFSFIFAAIKESVIKIVMGVWELGKAIWEGRWMDAIKIFIFEIVLGIQMLGVSLLAGIAAALGTLVVALVSGIYKTFKRLIFGKSSGGVVTENTTLVGEKGPELVKLPAGSRVISNANSRGMGGNTINVHVNGRVGASDAEIRDIANKVAREINIRMNRQGTTMMGG